MSAAATSPVKRGRGRPFPPTALQSADPETILQRYLNNESVEAIAASYGVTRRALNHFLLTNAEDVWKSTQIAKATTAKDEADDYYATLQARIDDFRNIEDKDQRQAEIEACKLQLPLARERARRAEWELERLLSRLYGTKPDIQVNIGSSLIGVLASLEHTIGSGEASDTGPVNVAIEHK